MDLKQRNIMEKILYGDEKNIKRDTYIWNLFSNLMYSLQSVVLLLVITRRGDLNAAGEFSIFYATVHMFATIGNYNMRNFQVSDAKNEFGYTDYWTSRVCTCLIMLLIGCGYGFFYCNNLKYFFVVLFLVGYRFTDGIEDVVHGYIQKEGRLDIASKARTYRILMATLAFCVIYIVCENLWLASVGMMCISILLLMVFMQLIRRKFREINYRIALYNVGSLLKICFPLCASSFLYNYLVNIPKYAIAKGLTTDIQAIFNILFLPVFVINLLSIFIFNPIVATLSVWWEKKDISTIEKAIKKNIFIILSMTITISFIGYFWGCKILGFIYNVDLSKYDMLLAIMILFGGIAALVNFMGIIVTILRKQNMIIGAYLIATAISFFISDFLVSWNGILGAGLLYGIVMIIVVLILFAVINKSLMMEKEC